MPVARLLRERSLGEIRWVALGAGGEAVALYLERPQETGRAVIGARLPGYVRRLDAAMGGAFVDLKAKGEAFLRLKAGESFVEGAAIDVEVAAEARRGKLARVRLADSGAPELSGAARWRASLNGGEAAPVDDRAAGDAEVQAAFDDALAATVTLRGGGRLQVERTEALVAADIDTGGRAVRGGRAATALAINLDAAAELARQVHLRGWGGLAVLDCVAPVDKAGGALIRAAFLEAFREISGRQVKALVPSVFGLMEISADWQLTPLADRLLEIDGRVTAETAALNGLRLLEAAARAQRLGRLALTLPAPAFAWLQASSLDAEAALAGTYGGRLTIRPGATQTPDVTPDP